MPSSQGSSASASSAQRASSSLRRCAISARFAATRASLAAVAAAAAATPTRLPSLPAATLIPAPPLAALPPTFTDRTYGGAAVPPATAPLPPLRKGPLPSVLGKPQQSPGWPAASVPKVSYYY